MVEIRSVPVADLDTARQLHNQYTASDVSRATFREWYDQYPELLLGAYEGTEDETLVGYCLGVTGHEEGGVELKGIAVTESSRRQGIGSLLLAQFESNAAELGIDHIGLGSAGGYVDEFYIENGYEPERILVRFDAATVPETYRDLDFEIVNERLDDGTKKLYVGVDEFDPAYLETVRDAFDDPEAIHIMEKSLD